MKQSSVSRMSGKKAISLHFSPDDLALISEALRIAALDLTRTAEGLELRAPHDLLVEQLRTFSERMDDLLARIEE